MTAKELMIGDWVINTESKEQIRDVVRKISSEFLGLRYSRRYVPIECIEPIPLTQSILEANGWIVKKNHVQKGNFGDSPLMLWHLTGNKILRNFVHEMEISDLSSDEGYRLRFRCDYVHELQHALRLCELDVIADNFKI